MALIIFKYFLLVSRTASNNIVEIYKPSPTVCIDSLYSTLQDPKQLKRIFVEQIATKYVDNLKIVCPCKMALIPYLLDEIRPRRIRDQLYGLDLASEDFLTDIFDRPTRHYLRPWRNLSHLARDTGSTIKNDKNKFQAVLDVQHFSPEEISVKIADNYVVVEGQHEEKKDDHGYISRQFKRRYALPEGCNPETVESKLSSDGVLTVTAPKLPLDKGERMVPISQTGPVRRKLTDSEDQKQLNSEVVEETKTPQKKRRR